MESGVGVIQPSPQKSPKRSKSPQQSLEIQLFDMPHHSFRSKNPKTTVFGPAKQKASPILETTESSAKSPKINERIETLV